MKRFLKILFLFLLLSFLLTPQVKAADINVDCPDSSAACLKSSTDPLFSISADGYWYPGRTITKTINLKNSSSQTREMAIRGTKTPGVGNLENVMHISIIGGSTVIWSGPMTNFYVQDKIGMGIFAPEADIDYDFTVFMSSGAGDEYQNKETVFDLTLGFWGEPASTPTPASEGGDGGGEVLGAGVSAATCNDSKPSSAPVLFSAVSGTNSATLTWTPAGDPVSYYLIAYGIVPGQYLYGADVGLTTSYTVNNLSGGTTYYFIVRAGNGCMPGPFSNELAATPFGAFTEGIATGFAKNVLGEATESAQISPTQQEEQGEVAGEEEEICKNLWWWWVPILADILLSIFIFWKLRPLNKIILVAFQIVLFLAAAYFLKIALCNFIVAVIVIFIINGIFAILLVTKSAA